MVLPGPWWWSLLLLLPALALASDGPGRETALLHESATFRCAVQGPDGDAAEVDIWWQFKGTNVTLNDRVQVRKMTRFPLGRCSSTACLTSDDRF